jgi:hypothetical protein
MPDQRQRRAFIVGQYAPGDANVERFRGTARRLGYDFKELRQLYLATTQPKRDDLLLFCAGRDIRSVPEWLVRIRETTGPQLVLYTHETMISPESALDYTKSKRVVDILVWDDTTPTIVEEHISLLHNPDSPIYPRIGQMGMGTDHAEPQAFISTPLSGSHDLTMKHAVQPVLRECGFGVERANDPCEESSIHSQIRRQIRASKLLVANIAECDPELSRHNPNVYFELGLAIALDVPVILIRPSDGVATKIEVPADISNLRRIEYLNEVDLVLQLYHGLKHNRRGAP